MSKNIESPPFFIKLINRTLILNNLCPTIPSHSSIHSFQLSTNTIDFSPHQSQQSLPRARCNPLCLAIDTQYIDIVNVSEKACSISKESFITKNISIQLLVIYYFPFYLFERLFRKSKLNLRAVLTESIRYDIWLANIR